MLDKDLIQSTSSWPFVEIRKLLKERKASGFKIFFEQTKSAFKLIIKVLNTFIFLILNYFFPNFAVKLNNKLKKN